MLCCTTNAVLQFLFSRFEMRQILQAPQLFNIEEAAKMPCSWKFMFCLYCIPAHALGQDFKYMNTFTWNCVLDFQPVKKHSKRMWVNMNTFFRFSEPFWFIIIKWWRRGWRLQKTSVWRSKRRKGKDYFKCRYVLVWLEMADIFLLEFCPQFWLPCWGVSQINVLCILPFYVR